MTSLAKIQFPPKALIAYYQNLLKGKFKLTYTESLYKKSFAPKMLVNLFSPEQLKIVTARGAPLIGQSYYATEAVIRKEEARWGKKFTNFIDLVPGLITRGVEITKSPRVTYVELDFKEMSSIKKKLVSTVVGKRPNLKFVAGDLRSTPDLVKASRLLPLGPVVIITEGVMSYLSLSDKAKVATAVRTVLKERDGIWITTNVEAAAHYYTPAKLEKAIAKYRAAVINLNSFKQRAFDSRHHIKTFFEKLGFSLRTYRQFNLVPFSTLKKSYPLPISDTTRRLLKSKKTLVLSLRK